VRKDDERMELSVATSVRRPEGAAMPASRVDEEDGELLRRIGLGDGAAFDALYRRYARPVYALALRRLGDRYVAEEAVQETFASVWRSARSYRRERGAASAWLYAIARNAVVDRFRARPQPLPEPSDAVAAEPAPEERAELGWVAWRVHRAVAELPDRERQVVELAYWNGLSQSEVAQRLELPLGTVKTRTRSALARLAHILEQEGIR
jgi:RNA polymerase sigma-70 factor, ECF subfamily